MTNVNDRGSKKWTAFMMPEHIEMLNNYWEKEDYIEKPWLSEDQYNQMNQTIQQAIEQTLEVNIQYHNDYKITGIKGTIKRATIGKLEIQTGEESHDLDLAEIVGVTII